MPSGRENVSYSIPTALGRQTRRGLEVPKPDKKRAKGDFRGIKLNNQTHSSGTDSETLLCLKSKAYPVLPRQPLPNRGTASLSR